MSNLQEQIRLSINSQLENCLTESVLLSPQDGIQQVRSILHKYQFELPSFYDTDPIGEEMFIEMHDMGDLVEENQEQNYLYIIYYLTEDNRYEFHAELVNEQELNEILSEDVTEE